MRAASPSRTTRVIACAINRKGGSGKTALSLHGAGSLAAANKPILLVDIDPQSSASQILLSSKTVESLPKGKTVSALFDAKYDPAPEHIVHPTGIPGLSIIPSSDYLNEHNLPLPVAPVSTTGLNAFIHEIRHEYSHILLDCPPNMQFCSWAALLASEFAVLAVVPESPATQGLVFVNRTIQQAQAGGNPGLRVLGMVLTMYNRNISIHRAYAAALRTEYGSLVCDNPMILATVIKEAVAHRQPVEFFAPRSAAARAMRLVTAELLARAGCWDMGGSDGVEQSGIAGAGPRD